MSAPETWDTRKRDRAELGPRPAWGLLTENSGWPSSLPDKIVGRYRNGVDRANRMTPAQLDALEAEVEKRLRDPRIAWPVHDIDCPCQGCEEGYKRLLRDVLPKGGRK